MAGQGVSVPQCVCNGRRATTGQDAAVKRLNVQYKHHSTENHLEIQHGYEQHRLEITSSLIQQRIGSPVANQNFEHDQL